MHVAARNYLAAGVALVGASAIAVSPVSPPLPDIAAVNPAIQLTAAIDPITPWLNVFNTSEINFANLVDSWLEAPAPVLQQVIANQIGYLGELPDLPAIVEQIAANVQAAIKAPFAEDTGTLDGLHGIIYDLLLNGLPPIIDPVVPANLAPLVQFSTTYLSGVLLGLVGPVINPALALGGSLQSVLDNLTGEAPDLEAALNQLINTPAAMADAFLNGGQSVDITQLLNAVGVESPLPGLNFSAQLVFGGLLSPGGSIFNALSIDLGDGSGPTGVGPGAIGSLIGLTKAIAKAIGWDGTGNPLAPPLDTQEPSLTQSEGTAAITATPSDQATLVSLDVPDEAATAELSTGAAGETGTAKDEAGTTGLAADESASEGDVTAGDTAPGTETSSGTDDDENQEGAQKGNPLNDIRTGIEGTVKHLNDGLKDLGAKFGPKEKPAKADSTKDSTDSGASSDKGASGSDGDSSSDGSAAA